MTKEAKDITIPIIVSLAGLPKSGKNHFSYTWPSPIKVYCFNYGASFVKTKFPSKEIVVANFSLPILESTNMTSWALPVWRAFHEDYKADIAAGKYQTYVFDTGTELETILRQAVLEEIQEDKPGRKRLDTTEYGARNMDMLALFNMARYAQVNLITLQYLKEKWEKNTSTNKNEPTGQFVLDGWAQTESAVDIAMEIEEKGTGLKAEGVKGDSVMVTTIKKCRFDRNLNRKQFKDLDYTELMAALGV